MKQYLKRKLRTTSGILVSIIILSTVIIGLSYGTFVLSTDKYKATDLLISELTYAISIQEDGKDIINSNTITIPANTRSYYNIIISSVNKIDSNYILGYKGNATVKYTDKTSWISEGYIKGYDTETYSKSVRVMIENTSNTSQAISFKVYGGYTFNTLASISLKDDYVSVPGPYTETVVVSTTTLTDIINNDNKCVTEPCLYSGGSINNYIQYPENSDKTKNIWRIIGSYNIDGSISAKLISESTETTTQGTITTSLTSFYNKLEKPNLTILETDKFNCTESGCTSSTYSSKGLGLISTYEYNKLGGYNSYLGRDTSYFALEGNTIKNITKESIDSTSTNTTSGLRPSIYLKPTTKVSGRGTKEDPYVIIKGSDINLISWTYKGQATSESYENLVKNKYVQSIKCDNGTKAEWDEETKSVKLTNVQAPDYCTIDFGDTPLNPAIGKTLYTVLTDGKKYPTVKTAADRGSFDTPLGGTSVVTTYDTTKVIYKESTYKEEGKDIYYFAGNPQDNWVKFAGFYWRIIRTNEDGSVRLLYAGTSPETTEGYIGTSKYNSSNDNTMYVGWMYGTTGSIGNNRKYTNSSNAKTTVESWYKTNIYDKGYDSLVSQDAIYCNDRASGAYVSSGDMSYAARDRLYQNGSQPSYQCGQNSAGGYITYSGSTGSWNTNSNPYTSSSSNVADRFSKTTDSGGNGKLTYSVGLMTADEVAFAGGGRYGQNAPNTYYYNNSNKQSVTGLTLWWTMSPCYFNFSSAWVFIVFGSDHPARLEGNGVDNSVGVRPVVSLAPTVVVTGGIGTATDPYTVG